ncbi:MAG: alpha/beta hydrolase [Planctomycetota bacterium]
METDFTTTVVLSSSVRVARAQPGAPLVIALHGKGSGPGRLERRLRPALDRGGQSWWLPRGILPYEAESSRIGYAWYAYDGDQRRLRAGMDEARAYLVGLTETARRALCPSSVSLLGFSQGGYLASYLALSRPDLYRALVCCCARPKAEFIADLGTARRVAVLVQTGRRDTSVPPDLIARGVEPLRVAGLEVTVRSYDVRHELTQEMARDAGRFLGGLTRRRR